MLGSMVSMIFFATLANGPEAPSAQVAASPPPDSDKVIAGSAGLEPPRAKLVCPQPARFYPEKAARMGGIPGRAVINCQLNANGTVSDCRLVSESPTGYGFGDAALCLAPLFKAKQSLSFSDDPPVKTRRDIPIVFKLR